MDFDLEQFLGNLEVVNPGVNCILVSARTGQGVDELEAAAQNGWLDEERAVLEALTGIKRAGAEIIISYHAPDVARWLAG